MLNVEEIVYNFKTQNLYGFSVNELKILLLNFSEIKLDTIINHLSYKTVIIDFEKDEPIFYKIDVYNALRSALNEKK